MEGIVLPVVEYGDPNGEPIIGLHGVTKTGRHWERIGTQGLPDRRWICPTMRGNGGGPDPEGVLRWSIPQYARDVLATMDELRVEAADIAGTSAGGLVAIEIARLAPHRVRSLSLLDPPLMTPDEWFAWIEGQPDATAAPHHAWSSLDEAVDAIYPGLPSTARRQATLETAERVVRGPTGSLVMNAALPDVCRREELIRQIGRSLPVTFDAYGGRVLLFIAEHFDAVSEAGHRAVENELGDRLTSVRLDTGHAVHLYAFESIVEEIRNHLDLYRGPAGAR
jgi:pimeloyl-ACP methyl ester carboxylesterase